MKMKYQWDRLYPDMSMTVQCLRDNATRFNKKQIHLKSNNGRRFKRSEGHKRARRKPSIANTRRRSK